MNIGIYGGSIRPGGGLTVLKQVILAVASMQSSFVYVYTGAKDSSEELSDLISRLDNVEEIRFFPAVNAKIRYSISKFYFINESKKRNLDILISINYFIPALCKTVVYHLNLLSFMCGEKDTLGMKIKRFDARLACKYATANMFESDYLLNAAKEEVGVVNNGKVLYVGVSPEFSCEHESAVLESVDVMNYERVDIAVVSSPAPHKDNMTCLQTLSLLVERFPRVKWRMSFIGGLSLDGWESTKRLAEQIGLLEYVNFSGPMDKKSLSSLLNNSLCLLNASLIESFCMVAVEAMKSCCPAIVTNATSMPESVGYAGIIVKAKNSQECYEAVVKLYTNKNYRNDVIKNGLSWSEQYSVDKFKRNITKILNELG